MSTTDFPIDFFLEILLRIPTQPLHNFRRVCKTWLHIIDNPSFTRSHAHHHRNSSAEHQILIRNKSGNSYKLSLASLTYSQSFYDAPCKSVKAKDLDISVYPGFSKIIPVASCDGLILFSESNNRNLKALWNPLTREFLELPDGKFENSLCLGVGFGYDVVDNDYKIARLSEVCVDGVYFLRTFVYSLKLDSWARIQDFEGIRIHGIQGLGNGVFVDGEVYWIGFKEEETVVALDFCTESYRVVMLPSLVGGASRLVKKKLDVMGGCLFLSYFNDDGCLDLWMMKDFGERKEWSRLFLFLDVGNVGIKGVLKPIAYVKSKDLVLVQHDQNDLLWLDVENKKSKKVVINGLRKHSFSQVFKESMVRLNEGGRVAGVRSVDPAKRKPLKLTLNTSDAWNFLDIWGDSFSI